MGDLLGPGLIQQLYGQAQGWQLRARTTLMMLRPPPVLFLLWSCHCSSSFLACGCLRFVRLCGFWGKPCVTISVLPNLEKAEVKISQEMEPFVSSIHMLMLVFP